MKDEEFDRTELTKEQAFKLLYPLAIIYFRDRIYGCEDDFEDLASDVMVDLFTKWDELETHTLRGLRVWLYRAVRFAALNFIKRQDAQPLIANIEYAMRENPELEYENFAAPPPDVIADEEFKRQMRAIKQLLPPQDFQLLDLRLRGHSPPEVAKILGLNEGTERTRFCRIRKLLQEKLKKY